MISSLFTNNNKKKGNVFLIVICVFVILLILFSTFLSFSTSRVFSTKKLGDTLHARELAKSLALLSFNYLKNVELKNNDSTLRSFLSLPFSKLGNKSEKITDKLKKHVKEHLKNGSEDIISSLVSKSGLKNLKWEVTWLIHKVDFKEIKTGNTAPYPREKTGFIRVLIKMSYVLPGSTNITEEDYLYISPIKVVANILPVLSKFSLYVKDALNGEEGDRFNVIDTKASGDLNPNPVVRPWVINNGENSEAAKDKYDDIINDSRGVIYLGGGTDSDPIVLGLARGWADDGVGKYGEDFHFFRNSDFSAGYWKTIDVWDSDKGLMCANIGLCNDESDEDLIEWQAQLGAGFSEKSKYNSLFKLYGTDGKKSPTLVFGYVDSLFASIRMYKFGNYSEFLLYIDKEEDYCFYTSYDGARGYMASEEGYGEIRNFYRDYLAKSGNSELKYEDYLNDYASKLWRSRYNKGYMYILTNNTVPYPDIADDKLNNICKEDANDIFEKVPYTEKAHYEKIFGENINNLDTFLNPKTLRIDGSSDDIQNQERLSYNIKASETNGSLINYLIDRKLLKINENKNELDLNGWLYIDCDNCSEISLDYKINVVSNGGIIVSNGDINIRGDIECSPGAHLTLLSLNKNIVIEGGVKQIEASLIAGGGQIKLIGRPDNTEELTVNGNIVMNTIESGPIKEGNLKRGLNLNYKNVLSAIPYKEDNSEEDRSELPLLMFDLVEDPEMLN